MDLFDRGGNDDGHESDGKDASQVSFEPPAVNNETTEEDRHEACVEQLKSLIPEASDRADRLEALVAERTVDVNEELDEDGFFSTVEGHTTVTNRYDLEKAVPYAKKHHFREVERYWVNKPYAFVTIFHSEKENETK